LQSIKTHESDCREKSTKKKEERNQGKKKVVSVPAKPKEKYNKCIYMQAMSKRLAFIAGAHQKKKKKKKKKKKRIHSTRNESKPCGPSTKPGGDLHLFSPRLHEKES
jgi:NCAIR mutase (PurE)-related protein